MNFQQIVVGLQLTTFEGCNENGILYVRDNSIIDNPKLFPKGYIELQFVDPSYSNLTPEALLCLRDHDGKIIGYMTIKIGDNNSFHALSRAFSSYLMLVYKTCRWLDLPVDKINLYSN